MNDNIQFAVHSSGDNPHVGGGVALNTLAKNIQALGYQCSKIQGSTRVGDRTMVIYPEHVKGNPTGAKYVTRWLLNTPGFLGGDGVFGENDLVYKYLNRFKAPDESKVLGELRAYDLHLDIFANKGGERNGFCYTARHAGIPQPIGDSIDDYPNKGGHEWLAEQFNRYKYFYSWCDATMLSVFAALCGCISVVHPDGITTPEEWCAQNEPSKYGIAYGWEDIQHALDTQHMVLDHLKKMELDTIRQTQDFINTSKEIICSQS